MNADYYQIKEKCRMGLIKYHLQALSHIPAIENPNILDIGCGTGEPTISVAKHFHAYVTAVDINKESLSWLQKKISDLNLSEQIKIINNSFLDADFTGKTFDIILAEGVIHIVGFEKGFLKVIPYLKNNGYFIIHDEYKDHNEKIEFIEKSNCSLITTIRLDEKVWWDDYYKHLEKAINTMEDKELNKLFTSDQNEIDMYKKDAGPFQSIYYVIQKGE